MTATPETPVGIGEEHKNSDSTESKENGSTINLEKSESPKNTPKKEMPPNEADVGTPTAPTSSEAAPLASSEDLKVKFTGGARGSLSDEKEVKLEILSGEEKKAAQNEYPALTKAELMEFGKDPFWIGLRWGLFLLFWLIWVAMLVTSIVIIILAPKCPPPAPKGWWQKAPIYEVYVKSFKDSNGDGVGDIKGVTSKIDYLTSLGVGSVWMSPVYKSYESGDVDDHREIDQKLGSMDDFKELVAKLHENSLKLIMDFIPNHKMDLTQTTLQSPNVKEDLKGTMKFWLDLGVDGFRIDSSHTKMLSETENLDLLKEFRAVLDEYTEKDTYNPRVMMNGAFDDSTPDLAKYYGEPGEIVDQIGSISHMPLFFDMIKKFDGPASVTVEKVKSTIEEYQKLLPFENKTLHAIEEYDNLSEEEKMKKSDPRTWPLARAWPNYNIGNHDSSRAATRFGTKLLDAMNMVIMMLQGSTITYYGDEIGMVDSTTASGKNVYRTPMQWDETSNAGFTDGPKDPWLPVNPDYATVNVAEESKELSASHLKVYQELTKLRYSDSILYGDTRFFSNGSVFAYTRVKKGNPGYLVAVNFGKEEATPDVSGMELVPKTGTVQIRDSANNGTERSLPLDALTLKPESGIIIAFVPNFDKPKDIVDAETKE